MNIVSFLPAATEMAYALGLGDELRAVSHECDYPPEAQRKPVVVHLAVNLAGLSPREIDAEVSRQLHERGTLYEVDEQVLRDAHPDLILTQDLCQVCAPSGTEVTRALAGLNPSPEVLWMTPRSIEGILENIRDLGRASGRPGEAATLVSTIQAELNSLRAQTAQGLPRPRVFCMEWVDPVFCAGHWVPEMVEIAGGVDGLARPGVDSARIPWTEVQRWAPEVLVVAPCGYHLTRAREEAMHMRGLPGWETVPAVQQGRVFAVDADSYISRPGPRVAQGTRLLAHLFHPDRFSWNGARDAFKRIEP